MSKPKVIVICGPTASGKTALSIELAKKINGEIVSADSMQIYKKMDIGTAKTTKEEMQGIKHYMQDFVEPNLRYSVADYKKDIDKIEEKDFDIFGNVSEDRTKIKTLKNNKHRESEKDKYKVLNVNLNTEMDTFIEKLKELRKILIDESEKIEVPYDISLYKASNEKIEPEGFDKFSINPFETLNNLEKISTSKETLPIDPVSKETYLYKINVPEGTKLVFYSNITFFENNNQTLPLGMDISQEGLINMDLYSLELKNKDEFNINIAKDEFNSFVKKVKVYEYDIKQKQ